MKELIIATRWEVKAEGNKRSIQLYDDKGNKVEGHLAKWSGGFHCSNNHLTSLEGAPKEVGGGFHCYNNQLTTLEGAPKEVGGNFHCYSNQLTTLEGAPKEVGGNFHCYSNQLTTLEGAPKEVGGGFHCSNNHLTSLEGAPKEVGGGFHCYNNQLTTLEGAPKEVGGNFHCYSNQLTTLEGAPKEVGGNFHCSNNHLTSLEGAPKENSQTVTHRIFEEKLVKGYLYADGILEKIVSRKTKGDIEIFKTRKIGSKKESFVVKRGTTFSHGETIKQALEDLQYKISDRDTTEYKKWTLETQVTKAEMIAAYRKITGACSSGVKSFVESQGEKIKNKMTVAEVIALTRSSYGGNEFERFFK